MGSTPSRVAAGGVAAAAVTALALAVRQQRHDQRDSLATAAVSSTPAGAPRRSLPLAGLRIMVTGASQGIGLAVLRRLRMDGAHVVGVSRRAASEAAAAEACAGDAPAGGLSWIAADVSRMEDVEACVRQAGELDGLVNNAGIAELEPVLDMTPGAWDRVLATNLRAPAFLTQAFARQALRRGVRGSVVNVSSTASTGALASHAAYCSSKAALDMLTKCCATELGQHGIRVNAVNPTVTLTPMGEKAWGDAAVAAPMLNKVPLHRFAIPAEVAAAVAWLLSPDAGYISGVTLPVDGGFLAPGTVLPPSLRPAVASP